MERTLLSERLKFARFKLTSDVITKEAGISAGTLQNLINGEYPKQERIKKGLDSFWKKHPDL